MAARHGKMKKTAVDCFNDSHQEETRRLNLKRKMEHDDEKMASIRLKKHKYDLRYGSTPHTSGSPTPAVAAETQTKEDKQIEILRLQIRLAELNRDSAAASAHASASAPSHTSDRKSTRLNSSHSVVKSWMAGLGRSWWRWGIGRLMLSWREQK